MGVVFFTCLRKYCMRIHEVIKPKPPLTPAQARIAQLQNTATNAKQAVKQERLRQQQTKLNHQRAKVSV